MVLYKNFFTLSSLPNANELTFEVATTWLRLLKMDSMKEASKT